MFQNEVLSSLEHSFEQNSPNNITGEQNFDVNYTASYESLSIESGYIAGSAYFQSSSHVYDEQFIEHAPDVYSDNYIVDDGSQVVPVYYPIPTYYQLYNGVSAVESNGTTYYNYYQFAVPMYGYSDHITPSSNTADDLSDLPGDSIPEEFIDDFTESYDEASSSEQFTPSTNSATDVTSHTPVEEFVDDFTAYYDEAIDSSILIPENDFTAEERKNDIKRKKDWLYLLSLSGKLKLKDHIPTVDVMPVLFEDDETTEISENNIESDESLHTVSCIDISQQSDTDHGDPKKKCPDNVVLETSHALSTNKEPPEKIFLDREEEKDAWEDSFFCSIDDEEFGIESCFNNTFENQFVEKSPNNNGYRNKSNSSSRSGRTFMILRHLNKQVEILPTIYEEEEDTKMDDILNELTGSIPLNSKDENLINVKGESVESTQEMPEERQSDFGLPEATNEASPLQKPKKKRLERFRRFFSRMTNCFRITKESPG